MHISEENNVKVCLFVVFLRNNRKPTQLVRDRWGSVTVKNPKQTQCDFFKPTEQLEEDMKKKKRKTAMNPTN